MSVYYTYCTSGYHHNTINFLPNTQNRYHIADPWGLGMGCLLWVQTLIYVLPVLLQFCLVLNYVYEHLIVFSSSSCVYVHTFMFCICCHWCQLPNAYGSLHILCDIYCICICVTVYPCIQLWQELHIKCHLNINIYGSRVLHQLHFVNVDYSINYLIHCGLITITRT